MTLSLSQVLPRVKRETWSGFRSAAVLGCLLAVFAGAMVGLVVLAQRQASMSKTDAASARISAAAADDVATRLWQLDQALLRVVIQHQSLQSQEADPQARNASFFEALQREPYFSFIDVVDKNGLALAGRPRDANNWSTRDYFVGQEHGRTDSLLIGDRIEANNPETVGFTVSRRMTDGDGNFAGLVVMGVRLSYFRELLERRQTGPGRSLMLLRQDCTILLRLPYDFNTVGDRFPASLPFCAALPAWDTSVVASDPVDHVNRRFALHHVGTFGLVVSVGTASEGPFADHMTLGWLLAGGAATAAIGLLLWLGLRLSGAATRRSADQLDQ